MNPDIQIRDETAADADAIGVVTLAAFANLEISGHTEQFIVEALRAAGALALSLVAERDGRVVGHVAFSPVTISDGTPGWYGLGPVSVAPELQRQGIGTALIREGLSRLKGLHARGCCLVGHPGYYTRFGFRNVPGLVVPGVPPEFFFALSFDGRYPQGEVAFHEGFTATGRPGDARQGARIVYFSHGGGPLPILGDASHASMVQFMRRLPERLRKPEAIIVVSAHWEERAATLLGAGAPPMLYDYYGFPAAAYDITYPAPGNPALAERIAGMLRGGGVEARIDQRRGFDHGLFIPLKLMYPLADVPSIQLSLVRGLDPGAHLALGRALRGLAAENVLVVGSGFSFHNMGAFSWDGGSLPDRANDAFQDWLRETCALPLPQPERERRLAAWEKAPAARYCHPREEHLLPLHVCAAMAGGPAEVVFDDRILGKRALAFLW